MTGAQLRAHFGVLPVRRWTWEWTKGVAYRVRNLDWPPDVFAAVVDDFGNLVTVAWWAE